MIFSTELVSSYYNFGIATFFGCTEARKEELLSLLYKLYKLRVERDENSIISQAIFDNSIDKIHEEIIKFIGNERNFYLHSLLFQFFCLLKEEKLLCKGFVLEGENRVKHKETELLELVVSIVRKGRKI